MVGLVGCTAGRVEGFVGVTGRVTGLVVLPGLVDGLVGRVPGLVVFPGLVDGFVGRVPGLVVFPFPGLVGLVEVTDAGLL